MELRASTCNRGLSPAIVDAVMVTASDLLVEMACAARMGREGSSGIHRNLVRCGLTGRRAWSFGAASCARLPQRGAYKCDPRTWLSARRAISRLRVEGERGHYGHAGSPCRTFFPCNTVRDSTRSATLGRPESRVSTDPGQLPCRHREPRTRRLQSRSEVDLLCSSRAFPRTARWSCSRPAFFEGLA